MSSDCVSKIYSRKESKDSTSNDKESNLERV